MNEYRAVPSVENDRMATEVREAYRTALLLCVRSLDGDDAAFARLCALAGLRF